jgi:superfamily II DNA helicase RecQ
VYYPLAETLELVDPTIINIGCDRPNVSLSVTEFEGTFNDLKKHMPELETLQAGGKFMLAVPERSANRTFTDPASKLKKTIIYFNDQDRAIDLFDLLRRCLEPSGFSKYVHYSIDDSSAGHHRIIEEEFRRDVFRVLVVTDRPDVVSGARDVERVSQINACGSGAASLRRMTSAGRDGRVAQAVVLCQKGLIGSKQSITDQVCLPGNHVRGRTGYTC